MKPKVVRLQTKKPRHQPPEIEDVQEAFCGQYRKSMIPLADYNPMVAAEWFYEKNCGWGPEDFSHGSNVKAFWECQHCLRVYKATIANRVGNQSACPYCASKKVCSDNSLSVLFPEIAIEWHPSKNGKLKASAVMRASAKRAWWRCSNCAFEWEAAVSDRTFLGSGCPGCYVARIAAQKAKHVKPPRKPIIIGETEVPREWFKNPAQKYKTLAKLDPKVAEQWHPTKNGKWTPKDFSLASGVTAWWLCKEGPDHEWQATICHRTTKKRGCPFCAGKKVSQTSSLKYLFPELAKQWHDQKNSQLKPTDVTAGTDRKVWWQCTEFSEHIWEAAISSRVNTKSGCPFCSGTRVSAQNCLQNKFPDIAAQLHPTRNGGLTGKQITAKSGKKVWWICKKGPDHEWLASPSDRTSKGSGCPACASVQLSITNCLATLRPEVAKLWDQKKNGKLTPKDVMISSNLFVWWRCKKGHKWEQSIHNRSKAIVDCWECLGRRPPGFPAKER